MITLQVLQILQQTCDLEAGLTQEHATSYGVLQCSKGYYGPLCSLCLSNEDLHYGRTGSLECKPCRHKAAIASAYIVSIILVLCFLSFLIHLTLQENKDAAAGLPSVGRASELIKVRFGSKTGVLQAKLTCVSGVDNIVF